MSFFRDFKCFFGLFYFLGLSRYYPIWKEHRHKYLKCFPFAFFVTNVTLCSLLFLTYGFYPIRSHSYGIFLFIIKFLNFFPTYAVIYVNLCEIYHDCKLNDRLFLLCDVFKISLKADFNLKKFKYKLYKVLLIFILMLAILNITRICLNPKYLNYKSEFATITMQVYRIMVVFHALFYVYIFNFILSSINVAIKRKFRGPITFSQIILNADCQITRTSHLITYFRQIRFIHLKLSEIIWIFNKYRGLSLIVILLETVVSITSGLYGIFLFLHKMPREPFFLTRKYQF